MLSIFAVLLAFVGSMTLPLAVLLALAAGLSVRLRACGRWVRERDTSTWPDIKLTARLAIIGPVVGELVVALVAVFAPSAGAFMFWATAWFAVPSIVEGVLLLRCAEAMARMQRGY
jgi:hypothetical protein